MKIWFCLTKIKFQDNTSLWTILYFKTIKNQITFELPLLSDLINGFKYHFDYFENCIEGWWCQLFGEVSTTWLQRGTWEIPWPTLVRWTVKWFLQVRIYSTDMQIMLCYAIALTDCVIWRMIFLTLISKVKNILRVTLASKWECQTLHPKFKKWRMLWKFHNFHT